MNFNRKPDPATLPLSDASPMPFGQHKGQPMANVPSDYLHFVWHNGPKLKDDRTSNVAAYIRRCLPALRKENPDLIWS